MTLKCHGVCTLTGVGEWGQPQLTWRVRRLSWSQIARVFLVVFLKLKELDLEELGGELESRGNRKPGDRPSLQLACCAPARHEFAFGLGGHRI